MTDQVSDAQARKSTALVGGVLLALAGWNAYRDRPTWYLPLAGAGGLLLLIALAWPAGARGFHAGWMRLAAVLGWINSRIILSVFFFLILTPVGLIGRLFGRDPLDRRGNRRESYWIPNERTRQTPERFERLF